MGWVTIYITGKEDFRDDVREKLDGSDLKIMPGYITGMDNDSLFSDMYWVDEKIDLRNLKEAVGSKLVWKYRLRFYSSLEDFIESQNQKKKGTEFTDEERALIREMQAAR